MACKMYGWYYAVHPKYNYAPYYANVKDNSQDQNFYYNSYDSMNSKYKNYETKALNTIKNKAIIAVNTGNVFEVHYHANQGTKHSGTLNQADALDLAKQGKSYIQILHYYYDYTSYTKQGKIKLQSY